MQNVMNMKNKTHKCVPRNNQINLSAQGIRQITRLLEKVSPPDRGGES